MNLKGKRARPDNTTAEDHPAAAFGAIAKEGGQDESPIASRLSPRWLLCLGCVSVPKTRADVVRQLEERGCISAMGNSGVYRDIRLLKQAGLIQAAGKKKYELTEAGRHACPDGSLFERISEAIRVLEGAKPSPRGQLILGAIMQGPKTRVDIVNHLVGERFISPMAQSNIYRQIKAFEAAGIVRQSSEGMYELTEAGRTSCPSESMYSRIGEASRTLLELNASSPDGIETPVEEEVLAQKAAGSLARLDGVISEDILAPIRALINHAKKRERS